MKYLIQKDKKRRILFEKFEKKKICLKALSKDKRIPLIFRNLYKIDLNSLFVKNTSKSRIKNRCVITGRSRGILKYFRMSRHEVRQAQLKGLLYGVRKSSW